MTYLAFASTVTSFVQFGHKVCLKRQFEYDLTLKSPIFFFGLGVGGGAVGII